MPHRMAGAVATVILLAIVPASASAASLSLKVSPQKLFTWTKLDLTGDTGGGKGKLTVWRNPGSCPATLADEEDAYDAQSFNHPGGILRLTDSPSQDVSGAFTRKIAYFFETFDVDETICAYLYPVRCTPEEGCGSVTSEPPAGKVEQRLRATMAVTRHLAGGGLLTPLGLPPVGGPPRAGRLNAHGMCIAPRNKLGGRRWLVRNVAIRPDGSFSFNGTALADNTDNYDHPVPPKWPAKPHVTFSGRFSSHAGQTFVTWKVKVSVRGGHCAAQSATHKVSLEAGLDPPRGYTGAVGGFA